MSKNLLYTVGILIILSIVIIIFILQFHIPILFNLATLLGQPSYALPVRIKIPKIKLDANIEQVNLTSLGAVGVPKGITNAGWFNLGPRPGEAGNSIIDGHFGWWKNGTPGIFNNLYTLQAGDKIYVQDQKGVIVTFVVREIRTYDKNEDASGVFGSSDGLSHLDLITCEGVWIPSQKTYSNRLIVFADKE